MKEEFALSLQGHSRRAVASRLALRTFARVIRRDDPEYADMLTAKADHFSAHQWDDEIARIRANEGANQWNRRVMRAERIQKMRDQRRAQVRVYLDPSPGERKRFPPTGPI